MTSSLISPATPSGKPWTWSTCRNTTTAKGRARYSRVRRTLGVIQRSGRGRIPALPGRAQSRCAGPEHLSEHAHHPDSESRPVGHPRDAAAQFDFDDDASQNQNDPVTSYTGGGNWGIATDNTGGSRNRRGGSALKADFGRISSAPKFGTREIWTLQGGFNWDHPIHIHFEEGQILARNGSLSHVPPAEKRPQGCLSSARQRQRNHHHAVPRLGRHVYGALPQHHA